MKAKHVLYFVLGVILILAIIMLVFPKDGIRINDQWVFYFPTFEEMFSSDEDNQVDTDSIINNQFNIDDIDFNDSLANIDIEEIKKLVTPLEFPENNEFALDDFFAKLNDIETEGKVRIMHYGDSQIEGDRISAFIRSKLQAKFGGMGMGLCAPVPVYSQFSIQQSSSANWNRYTGFGYGTANSKSNRFGPMIAFARYAPETDSLWKKPSSKYSAWISFSKSDVGYSNTAQYTNVSIYYGNSKTSVKITLKSNEIVLATDSLKAGQEFFVYTYKSENYIDNLTIEFEGYDSPDVYAISFEDEAGIYVDNIALRGSSGTVFTTTDGALLTEAFTHIGVDLFILQFGGNSVPYILDKKSAEQFANHFYYQILFLKRIVPDACIIVIGPSDMAYKEKDYYITYPNLENIINALRNATHKAGGVYWDMYTAMGGKNSMRAWVNANPQMAGPDFIHFTPYGTQVISNMFYNAFILEYTEYCERNKK
ncbi:MAG TPA: hypothetical protein PLL66_00165 [Bacteroidales bacterium]|nr:hypothetical protein [Bacteroidales bacterium]